MGSVSTLANGQGVTQIGTTSSRFTDNFPLLTGSAFNSSKWNVVRNTGGVTVAGSVNGLVVSIPVTSGAELLVVGRVDSTIPANLLATLTTAARYAATAIRIGYVEVDHKTGVPVDNVNVPGDFANSTRVAFLTAVLTELSIESTCDHSTVRARAQTGAVSLSGGAEVNLEARPEDTTVSTATLNSLSARSATQRLSELVPDPNKAYAPFIWFKNTGTTTAHTVTLRRILSMDVQELQAEIGGGRGNSAGAMAVPVVLTAAGPTQPVSGGVSISGAVVSTTANGAATHVLISAATANPTSVKASAGKVVGGRITNSAASWRYLKFVNKTSAPTVGTDPSILTIGIPPNGGVDLSTVFTVYGLSFSTGIAYHITALPANADTTVIGANEVVASLLYV